MAFQLYATKKQAYQKNNLSVLKKKLLAMVSTVQQSEISFDFIMTQVRNESNVKGPDT